MATSRPVLRRFSPSGFVPRISILIAGALFPGIAGTALGQCPPLSLDSAHHVGPFPFSGPWGLKVRDLNQDGRPDVVVACRGVDNISVLLGQGGGQFAAHRDFPCGDHPIDLETGDFDGDGDLDIVTANFNGGTLTILLGDGTGSFVRAVDLAQGPGASTVVTDVAVGDLNGDGKLDLAANNGTAGAIGEPRFPISVYLGNGDGTFQPPSYHAAPVNSPSSLEIADMNADGKLDILAGGQNVLSVLPGNGAGGFGARVDSPVPSSGLILQYLIVADMDENGTKDVVMWGENRIMVILGDGANHFQVSETRFGQNNGIAVGDMTGDQHLDVVVGMSSAGNYSLQIFPGNGNGGFLPQCDTPFATSFLSFGLADFDSDGDMDVAAVEFQTSNVVILESALAEPVAVELLAFSVEAGVDGRSIRWQVSEDSRRMTYSLFRQEPGSEVRVPVAEPLTGRLEYAVIDRAGRPGPVDYWLSQTSTTGRTEWYGPVHADALALAPRLDAAPNPFRSVTTLDYVVPVGGRVEVAVFDPLGRRVRILEDALVEAGTRHATWDGRDDAGRALPAGIYLVRSATGAGQSVLRVTLRR